MPTTRQKRNWLTPLSIPARKSGNYRIEHLVIPAGEKVLLNNTRNALLGDQRAEAFNLVYDIDTTWHELIGPTGTLMTDLPVEQRQMEACIKGMRGNILVGGLGLGLASKLLAQKKSVTHITVVEVSKDVIRLVEGSAHDPKVEIVCQDLFTFLENLPQKENFTAAFFDIWQSDSELTFFNVVCPLINMSRGKIRQRPVCWNEQVMRGQLELSIKSGLSLLKAMSTQDPSHGFHKYPPWGERTGSIWTDWPQPYWNWWKEYQPDEELANHMAEVYAGIYGIWDWQLLWQATQPHRD